MRTALVRLEFSRYRWQASYNPDTNKWVCSEYVLNSPHKGWDRFNTYDVYDDSIESHVAAIFSSRH